MNAEDIVVRCRACGGRAWIEEHMPCSDHPELVEYYICCRDCDRETGANPTEEWAKEDWDRMNIPEGVLYVREEVLV